MSHILMKKWSELEEQLKVHRSNLNRDTLFKILQQWSLEVKKIKDKRVQELYNTYLEYFEDYSSIDAKVTPWYSLKEIIDIELLNRPPITYDRTIIKVRDVLWDLLVFKSNERCPCCGDDNLRVMREAEDEVLLLTCDLCGCILDTSGEKRSIKGKLFPAPVPMIKSAGISENPV